MCEDFKKELIEQTPAGKLMRESNDITNQLVNENDPVKLEDLTNLFNMNMKKKNLARINKLSNLLELVDDEVIMRFTSEPETFDNDQLLKYMNNTQQTITNMEASIKELPLIQINNQKNEFNINNIPAGLDVGSRKRVVDAVMELISKAEKQAVDTEYEEEE